MRKLFTSLMFLALSLASFAEEQFIVKDGKPNAQIVIAAEKRPRMATLAALELQHFIQKMSGARLPIVNSPDASVPVKIYVGKSPETEKLGIKTDDLKYGAFKIASGEGWLALVGDDFDFVPPFQPWPTSRKDQEPSIEAWKKMIEGKTDAGWEFPFAGAGKRYWNPSNFDKLINARYGEGSSALWKTGGNTINGFWEQDENGSLNAVHDFLRGLGVRLYMAGEENEVIPQMVSVPLKELNKTSVPDYAIRNWMWYGYSSFSFDDVLWARRVGMNSTDQVTGPLKGPHGLVFVHASNECKKNHPEYYALFAGQRDMEHKGHGSVCFSSEGFEKETVKYINFIFDNFNVPSVDIWPGDGLKPCQCDKCAGLTPSEMVWGFANRVATEVYKTHPDRMITCGAYTSYVDAPDTIEKFSPNLAVWISNAGRPKMTDPQHWAKYWARIQKWQSKMAPGHILRLENNRYHIGGFIQTSDGKKVRGKPVEYPVIHPRAVARDLKALKGISLGDTGEQSQFGGKWKVPGIEHITLYVQSRFLWDADLDVDEVLNEYCATFYGPAAKQMKAAIDFAETNLAVKDTSRGAGKSDLQNVSLEVALKFRELLKDAKKAAGDSVYGKRVDLVLSAMVPEEDLIAKEKAEKKLIAEARANAPTAVGVEGSDLSKAQEYFLKKANTGEDPQLKTSFKVGWDNHKNALILEITCREPKVKNLAPASDVYSGEYVAVTIQTQRHSHYIMEINPDGLIMEGNPVRGWKSLAKAEPERGEDFWRLRVTIPVVGAEEADADPNHHVAGAKPTPENPWYINIGRQIQKTEGRSDEIQLFSLSPKTGWHDPVYFGKLEIK
ncbi:MAG TPA: DUF4838 domain-containing protein [Victivallales bacterium]|nr:DUF4838 domain-containing protein [Victivallales bacterium]